MAVNFESSRELEKRRQELRESRQIVLEKAREKYEREEYKKQQAKERGEGEWMLASVNDRIVNEQMKKKKEKKKKERKEKKKKHNSSSSDSSDDASMWVEKSSSSQNKPQDKPAIKGPMLQRDEWMNAPMDLFPTVTRKDLIEKKNKENEELQRQKELLEKPGSHALELNPYWKDGGTGVPEEDSKPAITTTTKIGDGGASWLKKAYKRCVEQAQEEGRTLEEIAAERYGSLKKLKKMIEEAEEKERPRSNRPVFMRPVDEERNDSRRDRMVQSGSRSSSSKHSKNRSSSRSRSRERKRHNSGDMKRYRSRERESSSNSREQTMQSCSPDKKKSRSNDRSRSRSRNRSRSRDRNKLQPKERDRKLGSRDSSWSRDNVRQSRSRSKERHSGDGRHGVSGSGSLRGRFMKPGDIGDGNSRHNASGSRSDKSHVPAWKKKEFHKPTQEEDREGRGSSLRRERENERRHRKRSSTSESSSSESSSSSSESESSDDEGQQSRPNQPVVPEVKILNEKEMNALGAKIVKAELMGNQEQAAKLKAQLEAAREAKKNAPVQRAGSGQRAQGHNEDDDDFVTLTRTDRSGMARPVPEIRHPVESGGKRRKKPKVETHAGKQGERTRYFADDDKYDLKTLVEREKMGTAEDQNQMFARLAGRATEKTDDDFQMDDMFVSKANQKQSESIEEQRERAAAIHEHKKMAGALEKCHFCFSKVPKHLIVAIGTKSFLMLPHHKSLTEGHCLIIPMQHIAAGTALDEDVWSEMQVFRKTLTQMYRERDQDVVIMETSMRLKYFPHMFLECVPMDREIGDMAPIYFKKALQESESEWSQNKKVVDLSNRDVRRAIPKGFPYFAVDFGNEGGFAHVIEDEQKFPSYFGREILGGMIDADHTLWRKPRQENFDDQRRKVMQFAEMWKPFDWTQNISKKMEISESDSDSD